MAEGVSLPCGCLQTGSRALDENSCLGFLWSEKCFGHLWSQAGKITFWSMWYLENSPIKQNPVPLLTKHFASEELFSTRAERLFSSNAWFGTPSAG